MKWALDAETAIKKVPFFIRKKVKKRVEAHAAKKGKPIVELDDVEELKKKFLSKGGMEKEINGYEVAACFGNAGCPNTIDFEGPGSSSTLAKDIEALLEKENILGFLKRSVKTDLKFHHEFRVVIADCPNACSRPQIVDVGLIAAARPGRTEAPCSLCSACIDICSESAVTLDDDQPVIAQDQCVDCGKCISACPTGTLARQETGWRVLLGGRLGRHPRLGMEVPGLFTHDQVLEILARAIRFYKTHSTNGQRFSQVLTHVNEITG